MNMIYALVTRKCNLSCPHCDVQDNVDHFNHDLFMKELRRFPGNICIFGGEPSLYPKRVLDIVNDPIIKKKRISITTNLVSLPYSLLRVYKSLGSIGTSWNLNRFNEDQYLSWKDNMNILEREGIHTTVLITLTRDLLDTSIDEFIRITSEWNFNVIHKIKFELYVGDTSPQYYEDVDKWLCELHQKWSHNDVSTMFERVNSWCFDCSGIYTLLPDGTVYHACPHYSVTPTVPQECYTCEKAGECNPCRLHTYCSYPKKFADMVKKGEIKRDTQ